MKEIEKMARRILARYQTDSPFSLCDCMDICVLRLPLPECVRGLCFHEEPGRPVIVLNDTLSPREEVYCCAHELGHVLLHPGLNAQTMMDLTDLCVPKLENEADFFAACLLVDPNLEEWKASYDSLTAGQIARLSGLPEKVVRLRFAG